MDEKRDRISEMAKRLLTWYPSHARDLPWRRDKEPYHVWLSEIMLQQTRVEAVKGYYHRFLAALPELCDLAKVPDDQLLKLWEGLGYYNRARNLKKAAIKIMEDFGGRFPEIYEEILSLPGIGAYTAGAISSICFDLPEPAVDGNVLRVYTRVMEDASNIDKQSTKTAVTEALRPVYVAAGVGMLEERQNPTSEASSGEAFADRLKLAGAASSGEAFAEVTELTDQASDCEMVQKKQTVDNMSGSCGVLTQSLMELGATVCVPNGAPKCEICPLQDICLARAHDTWNRFPVREEKKRRRQEDLTVFILQCQDHIAIRKREQKGLLYDMWEFPNVKGILVEQQAADTAAAWETAPERLQMQYQYTHIFTHVEWRMTAYYLSCRRMNQDFTWVTLDALEKEMAVPSAFRPFIEVLRKDESK